MLANSSNDIKSGRLEREIHLPSTAKLALVEFIAEELPQWRDHPDRPTKSAETDLTEHLCDHLNTATYHSSIWSHVQFRTETSDETLGGRKIDLSAKPRAATFIIEGRRHTQFDALFPIECKRLPTPKDNSRDEREYVITEPRTTGGIQRFKFGLHGAADNFAAMIAFVQERDHSHWLRQVNNWIRELSEDTNTIWDASDYLHLIATNSKTNVNHLESHHKREKNLPAIKLRHLWIEIAIQKPKKRKRALKI